MFIQSKSDYFVSSEKRYSRLYITETPYNSKSIIRTWISSLNLFLVCWLTVELQIEFSTVPWSLSYGGSTDCMRMSERSSKMTFYPNAALSNALGPVLKFYTVFYRQLPNWEWLRKRYKVSLASKYFTYRSSVLKAIKSEPVYNNYTRRSILSYLLNTSKNYL